MKKKSFTITLNDEGILLMLERLHKLNLIQLIPDINSKSTKKISFDKYSGALSEKEGEEIKKEIQKGREEWNRRITY